MQPDTRNYHHAPAEKNVPPTPDSILKYCGRRTSAGWNPQPWPTWPNSRRRHQRPVSGFRPFRASCTPSWATCRPQQPLRTRSSTDSLLIACGHSSCWRDGPRYARALGRHRAAATSARAGGSSGRGRFRRYGKDLLAVRQVPAGAGSELSRPDRSRHIGSRRGGPGP